MAESSDQTSQTPRVVLAVQLVEQVIDQPQRVESHLLGEDRHFVDLFPPSNPRPSHPFGLGQH